ncbi:MAG: prolyl oligopeptidase family serine peptidase [Acidobacteria bacterium]|nr:prolyl oligopeptidase family serine peptidase [Acidobacteriota bacterium]
MRSIALSAVFALGLAVGAGGQPIPENQPSAVEREMLEKSAEALGRKVAALRAAGAPDPLLADVEIYHKALVWILGDPEEFYRKIYAHDALLIGAAGLERAAALERGEHPWTEARGLVARAYRSRVDGSVQPYLVHTPEELDTSKPQRLDLIIHGRNSRLNEVSFLTQAERSVGVDAMPADRLQVQAFGRTNNAYRWSGETDVLEALEATKKHYLVDERRVALRGFSMGGAGGWGLGLHYPDLWAAVESGAGFTETLRYAEKTLPHPLPAWQRPAMHIYDAEDYSVNAYNTAMVGYGGEDDAQLQASVNIREALMADGAVFRPEELDWIAPGVPSLRAIFLVGPHTGHKFHPASKAKSEAFLAEAVQRGVDPSPDEVRFVTYTTAYSRCFWVTVDGLDKLYERAEVRASRADGRIEVSTTNVSRLFLGETGTARELRVDGEPVELPAQRGGVAYLAKRGGAWRFHATAAEARGEGLVKRPGLQGPIDDAFRDGFVVVGPSGGGWNEAVGRAIARRLETFGADYHKWLRADLPREARAESNHRVLFGDPSSNAEIAAALDKLPLEWTREQIRIGGKTFDAATHVPVLIYPDPRRPDRYLVLNSGHTFSEPEFRGTNALLYPRLGDWAVLRASDGVAVAAGYFDENWGR